MMNNHLHNLMTQLVQENKSLWRIKKQYQKDAGKCKDCTAFWKKMVKDKESHIEELEEMIKAHME